MKNKNKMSGGRSKSSSTYVYRELLAKLKRACFHSTYNFVCFQNGYYLKRAFVVFFCGFRFVVGAEAARASALLSSSSSSASSAFGSTADLEPLGRFREPGRLLAERRRRRRCRCRVRCKTSNDEKTAVQMFKIYSTFYLFHPFTL